MSTPERRLPRFASILIAAVVGIAIGATPLVAGAAGRGDDPGPHLQYGGTPIELHYDAPGANVTKVSVDGTPCIIVSDGDAPHAGNHTGPVIALSCDWSRR